MITKRTTLDRVEVLANGTLQIRLLKIIAEDETVLAQQYHRTVVPPGTSIDEQFAAVNVHLQEMGFPAVGAEDIARLQRLVVVEHTPEVVNAYLLVVAANAAASK